MKGSYISASGSDFRLFVFLSETVFLKKNARFTMFLTTSRHHWSLKLSSHRLNFSAVGSYGKLVAYSTWKSRRRHGMNVKSPLVFVNLSFRISLTVRFLLLLTLHAVRGEVIAMRSFQCSRLPWRFRGVFVTRLRWWATVRQSLLWNFRRAAFDSAKNHERQRRKRQSVTAKREKSQTPKFA